ncbi:MAG: DUF3137 domain-containing protein, partial [Lachnospiraceae bacterium]|nr:DUF3137 domain-containing protein [Lachnospiraceae bacterium]
VIWAETLDKTRLSKYKFLYLPTAKYLDDGEIEAIREWVREGGVLVAEGTTSLFGGHSLKNRGNYALADIFGCDWNETVFRTGDDSDTFAGRHGVLSAFKVVPGLDSPLHIDDSIHRAAKPEKSIVVAKAAENLFDRYEYFPKNGFSYEEIRASGIMAMGNRYKSEDTIEGSYKNVSFRRADMYIAQHTSNGKSSHTTVYLRGTWMTFSYNKTFQSDLQILSKDFSFSNTHTSRLFTRAADRRHTFVTEDMAFNEAFTCTCQDESEAFYLLTPRIMQMLLLLRTEIGKPFMLGFVDNRLHFVISSHEDHMEPSVFGKCDLNVEVEKVRRELMVIRNVIDSLAMDRQLFE